MCMSWKTQIHKIRDERNPRDKVAINAVPYPPVDQNEGANDD